MDMIKDICPVCRSTVVIPTLKVTLFVCWDPRINHFEYKCPSCDEQISQALSLAVFAQLIGKCKTIVVKGCKDSLTFDDVLGAMADLDSTDDILGLMLEETGSPDEAGSDQEAQAEDDH